MATNTNTENIIVNVESKYKDKGLAELKKILSGTNLAMNNMEKAGKQNSDSFIKLQARTIALNAKINDLKKSYTDVAKVSKTAQSSTEQLTGGVKGLKGSYDSLETVLKAGIIAGLGKFIGDSMRMGAELEVLRSNFIGTTADLELFRKATAGTVTDGGLIQLSNYASDLGVSLKDQALLFSLAEDAADKYGGTVPENFERVINATDGTAKGLRAVGISTKQFNDELEKLLPTSAKTIDDLDAETQQSIRLQAILNLTGVTIDSVNSKQQDMADKLESVNVLLKDFTANMGVGMVKSLENYLNVLGSAADATGLFNSKLVSLQDIAQIVGMSLIQSPIVTFFQILGGLIKTDIALINNLTGLKLFQDSARGGNFSGNQGADIEYTPTDQYGRPMYSPSSYIAESGIKTPKIKTSSKGGGTTKDKGLTETEKEKLARQEAILSINALGQAEFYDLTKIKIPNTTDNRGIGNDWMSGMSDKELQSFLALENTPEEQSSTLAQVSGSIKWNNQSPFL